jgi:hypothetical protein
MSSKEKLAERVRNKIQSVKTSGTAFSPEMMDALRLAEQFEGITPQDYLLPIDEMAGFTISRSAPRKILANVD